MTVHPAAQNEAVAVRDGIPSDWPYVIKTWLRTYKQSSSMTTRIRDFIFFPAHQKLVENILRSGVTLRVAVDAHEPGVIYGFVVHEKNSLHFCYVKSSWRRMGIARKMLTGVEFDRFTHLTHDAENLRDKFKWADFDPYMLMKYTELRERREDVLNEAIRTIGMVATQNAPQMMAALQALKKTRGDK